jgi:fibronectin type 3 domain-containing protein
VDSFGATNYFVKRGIASGGPYTNIASVTNPSFVDLTTFTGVTNYYVVTAKNTAGESTNSPEEMVFVPLPWSNVAHGGTATASAQLSTQPAANAFDGTSSSKWYSNGGGTAGWLQYDLGSGNSRIVSGYDLTSADDTPTRDPVNWHFQGSANGSSWTTLDTQSSQSFAARYYTQRYIFTNSTAYRYYRLNILANGGDTSIQLSDLTLLSPSLPVPPTPTNLLSSAVSASQIDLIWNVATNADCYFVKRSTTNGGPYTTVSIPLGRRFSDNTLAPATTYYYVITAVNAGGESTSSTQLTATTSAALPPSAPTNLTASVPSVSRIGLTWNAVLGVDTYAVKRATVSDGPYTLLGYISGTSFGDSGLSSGTTYYYVVCAENSVGESTNSLEVSAKPNFAPAQIHACLCFDETGGVTAADSTGNGWNGTLVNSPTWVAGYSGNAVNLPNTASQYVSLSTGVFDGVYDFSIAIRVKQNAVSSWARAFDFGTGTSSYMFLSPKNGGTSVLRFAITASGNGNEQQINGTSALPTGAWKHVVVTLSGSVGIMYVDGVPVGTNSSMTLTPAALGSVTQNYLGKSQFPDPYLNGLVDDFRIYSGTLTPAQVATVYNAFPRR